MKENNWLFFADEDLMVAKLSLKENIFNQVCFHSQQCVEKSLKAYLSEKENKVPRVHTLVNLLKRCARRDSRFMQFLDCCKGLDRYYIPTRYADVLPGNLPNGLPDEKDANKAIEIAKRIFEFVGKI